MVMHETSGGRNRPLDIFSRIFDIQCMMKRNEGRKIMDGIWKSELGETRDIKIAVSEIELIITQLRKSKSDELQFIADMFQSAIDDDDQTAMHDFTA